MRRIAALAVALAGCRSLTVLPDDAACVDAGYAISRRTFECTGDPALADARFDRYRRDYVCRDLPPAPDRDVPFTQRDTSDSGVEVAPEDLFHCSYAISLLPCELVDEYGDDLDRWLATSDACGWIVDPAGSR